MATTKRIKSDKSALIQVGDWGHADELIRQISDHQILIGKLEDVANLKIDNIKSVLAKGVKGNQDAIKRYQESLDAFATTHRTDLKKKQKSWKLNFGIIGWRFSTSIKTKKTTLELIKQLFTKDQQKSCIIIKESVSKDALAKLTDQQLADIKARRDEKDVFFVEPASTEAADYNN